MYRVNVKYKDKYYTVLADTKKQLIYTLETLGMKAYDDKIEKVIHIQWYCRYREWG